jgi:hypothetical protein
MTSIQRRICLAGAAGLAITALSALPAVASTTSARPGTALTTADFWGSGNKVGAALSDAYSQAEAAGFTVSECHTVLIENNGPDEVVVEISCTN